MLNTDHPERDAPEDRSRYAVNNRREIERILAGMMREHVLLSATLTASQETFLTIVVGLDEDAGWAYLESKRNSQHDARLDAGVEFEARYQGVRVQFRVSDATRVQYDGTVAYRIAVPARLYRYQRREFYRMVLPALQPALCFVPLAGRELETHILDISVGGVGLRYGADEASLQPGQSIQGARLQIPNFGDYPVNMRVCTNQRLTLKNEVQIQRAGCEFVNLPATVERVIQNYIFKLEQERRMMGGQA